MGGGDRVGGGGDGGDGGGSSGSGGGAVVVKVRGVGRWDEN